MSRPEYEPSNLTDDGLWDCPDCEWTGKQAPIDMDLWELFCPDCGVVIDDSIRRDIERVKGKTMNEVRREGDPDWEGFDSEEEKRRFRSFWSESHTEPNES